MSICLTLSIIRYGSRVKWVNTSLRLGVVAIEKGAFGSHSTTVANNYIHLNVSKQMTDIKLVLLHINTWNHLTMWKQKINMNENNSC